YIGIPIYRCTLDAYKNPSILHIPAIGGDPLNIHLPGPIARWMSDRFQKRHEGRYFHPNLKIIFLFSIGVPGSTDCSLTRPVPDVITCSPMFSSKYKASFKPMPTAYGMANSRIIRGARLKSVVSCKITDHSLSADFLVLRPK